jgi:hypothetical protein
MTLTQKQIDDFVQRVVGTTLNMDTILEEEYGVPIGLAGLDEATLTEIDANVFECTACNWNVARDEESDGDTEICDECSDGDEED